jgi:hypothetical protein
MRRRMRLVTSQHTSAYVSIRQHTSAYVSIRQHTSAYVSMRACTYSAEEEHAARDKRGLRASELIRQHMSAYVSIRAHACLHI